MPVTREQKAAYARKYRADGRYRDREREYTQRTKSWPMCKAKTAVHIEVRLGRIPSAKDLKCVDCGVPAEQYDHRDYAKPLEVEPVCRSCNKLRGPGKNKKALDGTA